MSLRAIKKRENQINQKTLIKKSTTISSKAFNKQQLSLEQQQKPLVGRLTRSNPDLRNLEHSTVLLVRTKSEGDVQTLLLSNNTTGAVRYIGAAKSEVCLQSITSHNYENNTSTKNTNASSPTIVKMLPSRNASSHCDLTTHSAGYMGSPTHRRSSECSFNSSVGYSPRTSVMSTSAMTLSSSNDPNAVMRVPIIGYEVMEERARFTVYKLRVENPQTNDCWLVLRRYTDFVRLNTKLKQSFPKLNLLLPRKKIFGDNFNAVFLDNRVQGLQMFVNSIMAKEQLRQFKLVREFFCLDEPPTYSESMEECRAIFEAQEETIAHLKLQINNKNDVILSLQQKLREEMADKEQLKEMLKNKNQNGVTKL